MKNDIIPIYPGEVLDPEKFYHEINLLRVEGHYFSFNPKESSKKVNSQSFLEKIKTPEGIIERPITIDPNTKYGWPSVLAYKILQAIIKKYSGYGYPFPNGVPFSQRELARVIGRKSYGGWDQKTFYNTIMQLRRTGINCSFYKKESKEWVSVDFQILDSALFSGKKNKINQCFFCLSPIIINSLNNYYTFCLNFTRMEELEPIGSVFFKRLFFYFSNIYSKNKTKNFYFAKNYSDICTTWLGGLKVLKYKSKILQEQLGPHLKKLKKTGLIKKFEIAKNSNKNGFNLVFYPGKGFFEDYKRFYGKYPQIEIPFKQISEERYIHKPMLLVKFFYQKLLNIDELELDLLSESEVELASSFLEKYSFEDIKDWIEYSIEQAKSTGFQIKKFGGIKNYQTEFFIKKDQIKKDKSEQKKEQSLKLKEDIKRSMERPYMSYRTDEVEKFKKGLSSDILKEIEASVRDEMSKKSDPNKPWFKSIINSAIEQRLAELAGVSPFEKWIESQN